MKIYLLYECFIDLYKLSLTSNISLATFDMAYFLASSSYLIYYNKKILFGPFLYFHIFHLLKLDIIDHALDPLHKRLGLLGELE